VRVDKVEETGSLPFRVSVGKKKGENLIPSRKESFCAAKLGGWTQRAYPTVESDDVGHISPSGRDRLSVRGRGGSRGVDSYSF